MQTSYFFVLCFSQKTCKVQPMKEKKLDNQTLDAQSYEPFAPHTSKMSRAHYWAVAIGLQKVDGLEVSDYTKNTAENYIENAVPLDSVGKQIREYHANNLHAETAQADLVSFRIAEVLSRCTFSYSPEILSKIHAHLFQDLNPEIYHPGEFKTERMIKQEEILNGDSVLYADPMTYTMSLNAAFNKEAAKAYTTFDTEEMKDFCHTIAFLWQVHPFYEGNTRTLAVFSEVYLNYLGFSATNEPFEKHSAYYRDALVRSTYRNAQAKIFPDESFLVAFYENLLSLANNKLDREKLICTELFENPSLLRNVNPREAFIK